MKEFELDLNIGDRKLHIRFDLDSPVHQSILAELQQTGAYEAATSKFLFRALRPGDTFIDVGAHIGFFSLLASFVVGPEGKVIAVEPTDENYAQLDHNINLNKLDHIHPVKSVISDTDGEATFYLNKDNDGGHALWDPSAHPLNQKTRDSPESMTVRSMTLQSLMNDFDCSHVRLIKIDTEGAEAKILRGARALLKTGAVDFIIAEVNITGLKEMGDTIRGLFALARELGFVVCLPNKDGSPPILLLSDNTPDPTYIYNILLAHPAALASL